MDDPHGPAYLRLEGPNQWPPAQPELREVFTVWAARCAQVARRLMHAWATSLGARADAFDSAFRDRPSTLIKLIRYPGREDGGQGVGAHKDPGVLTLLMIEPGKGGLQVGHDDGRIDAPALPGARRTWRPPPPASARTRTTSSPARSATTCSWPGSAPTPTSPPPITPTCSPPPPRPRPESATAGNRSSPAGPSVRFGATGKRGYSEGVRAVLQGEKVALRERRASDVPVLVSELYEDVESRSRVDTKPWRPVATDWEESPFKLPREPRTDVVPFSVVELASGELAGAATVWGLDRHNRHAHLGLALRPACRGRGLGTDVVRVLARYAFRTLGLHRLQVETLADNAGMLGAAQAVGFTIEGRLRQHGWLDGQFLDEVTLGLLASEYTV